MKFLDRLIKAEEFIGNKLPDNLDGVYHQITHEEDSKCPFAAKTDPGPDAECTCEPEISFMRYWTCIATVDAVGNVQPLLPVVEVVSMEKPDDWAGDPFTSKKPEKSEWDQFKK